MSNIDENKIENESFFIESIRILHEAYKSKKLVLFVGAGVDIDSGVPCWSRAIAEFCRHLEIDDKDVDNLRIPQYYYNSRGKKEYVELCRKIFCHEKELPINDLQKKIVDFNVSTIITTNYTNFLEREIKSRGHIYRVIAHDKALPYLKNENLIIKMHGDFEHDNFVLKEDDYLNYSRNFRLIETYIKSIIAKNVVLFVGYSFNDPDVKQIFSWVKDILGDDFQQAYMLNAFDKYDKNVFEYYKHLGVNVIYTEMFDNDSKNALQIALDMIKDGFEEKISNIEKVSNVFKQYLELNYVLSRYVNQGLRICGLELKNGVLQCADGNYEGKGEAIGLLKEIIIQMNEEEQEQKGSEACTMLIEIIKKSNTQLINVDSECYMEISPLNNDMLQLIMEFDYVELKKMLITIDVDGNDDEKKYLQQAYIYYLLGEYVNAYRSLSYASQKAFYHHQYCWYFIAQFNKYRIKSYMDYDIKTSGEIQKKVEEDLKLICLDDIIMDIPDLSSNNNQFLKDIASFQLHYSLFQDAYRVSEKVKEQQNTSYSIFSGTPDYVKLSSMVLDYYQYITLNYIMVDKYVESKEILNLYARSMLSSVGTPDKKGDKLPKFMLQAANIHASEIGKFELFLMIKYMTEKDIMKIFSECNIDRVSISADCRDYMIKVIHNLSINKRDYEFELWNCILVASYIDVGCDFVEQVTDEICDRLNDYIYRVHKDTIRTFLSASCREKRFKPKQDGEYRLESYAIGRLIRKVINNLEVLGKERDSFQAESFAKLLQELMYMHRELYGEAYSENINGLLSVENGLIVAKIYSFCDEHNREIIKEYFEGWIDNANVESCEIYYNAVIEEIIGPKEDYESKIWNQIDSIKEKSKNTYPSEYDRILSVMCNLFLNNKIIDEERFKAVINESDDDSLIFLSNMENFDYSRFQLEWLLLFSDKLMEDIANRKTVRDNIAKIYIDKIEKEDIDRKLLKKYFRYLSNIDIRK